MPKVNLKRVYTLREKENDENGAEVYNQYGPGETDVPDYHIEELKARRAIIEPKSAKAPAKANKE